MITSNLRIKKYRELPELLVPLYAAPESGTFLYSIYENNLTVKYDYKIFGNLIGDTILGFHKTSELTNLLQTEVGVSADDAQRIYADLEEFLAPVIAREKGEVNPNQDELQKTFTPSSTEKSEEEQTEIAPIKPTEEADSTPEEPKAPAHSTVQPMRTMESDMNRIHGYGAYRAQFPDETKEVEHVEETIRTASQEELLQEKPKLTDMPTYEEGEEVEEVGVENKGV